MKEKSLLEYKKHLCLQDSIVKQFGKWWMKEKFNLIKLLPDKEELIKSLWNDFVTLIYVLMKEKKNLLLKKILYMQEFQVKSNWTILIDKLTSSDPKKSILLMMLLQIYVQDSILREKDCVKFWTPAYKRLSEKLLLHTKTDLPDLDMNSLNNWSQEQVVQLQSLERHKKNHTKKNLQKTCCQSFISSLVDKWEKENIKKEITKLKTVKIKLYPTIQQKKILNEFINTYRYVYNKTVNEIENNKEKINFFNLRNKLVTYKTKKNSEFEKEKEEQLIKLTNQLKKYKDDDENKKFIKKKIKEIKDYIKEKNKTIEYTINSNIKDFELNTPKDLRACAIKNCCNDYKTAFANLKNGNIRYFKKKFKKKTDKKQSFAVEKENVKFNGTNIILFPSILKENSIIKIGNYNKKYKNIKINHQSDFCVFNNEYYIYIVIKTTSNKYNKTNNIASIDPGLRDFATVHVNNFKTNATSIIQYKHPKHLIDKLNNKIDLLNKIKKLKQIQYRLKIKKENPAFIKYPNVQKKHLYKLENRKKNITNQFHWSFINDLLLNNDIIYFGDIKSHDVVTNGKNRKVNRHFNDLKFYQLKQKLIYKTSVTNHRIVYYVNEAYTSKTCSSCGTINDIGSSKVYKCSECNLCTDRDENSAKNIKMKGFLTL